MNQTTSMRSVLLCSAILFASTGFAQTSDTERQWWLNISAGLADGNSVDTGTLFLSSLNFGQGRSQFQLREFYYESGTPFDFLACAIVFPFVTCEISTVDEWGLLYGRRFLDGELTFSTGVGRAKFTGGPAVGPGGRDDVCSVPLELSWSFGKRRWHGWSAKLAVSLNSKETLYGFAFGVDLGRLEGW